MKLPALRSKRAVFWAALLYPILLETVLYYNVVWYVQLFNILLLFLAYALCMVIFRRLKPALGAITFLMAALSIANEFSITVRSVAFQFTDFFCMGDAMRLSGRYRFTPTWGMAYALLSSGLLLTIVLVLMRDYHDKLWKKTNLFRGAATLCVALPAVLLVPMEKHHEGDLKFDINTFTRENGVLYSLYVEAKTHEIEPPEDYDAAEAAAALAEEAPEKTEDQPNIIVVMNESLADFDLVGDLPLTEDVMPYLHSLDGNCIKGKALVSVYGGYTCNSEWEFLTGNSLAFMPVTCIPYNQLIDHKTYSLAQSLRSAGYQTTAMHPYHGEEWKRESNYPLLGFDRFITGNDLADVTPEELRALPDDVDKSLYFGDLEYIRGFVSDAEDYRKIISLMEEKEAGTPQFIFNVTIQNHSSYTYDGDDFTAKEFLPGAAPEINQYLTIANESDKALKLLIDYFEDYPEDTILLVFGDHQPSLDMPYTERYTDTSNKVAVRECNYTVPYLMWANYDVDWETQDMISLNYLSAVLKQNAGLPADKWDAFRLEAMQTYPAVNSYGALSADGSFIPLKEALQSDVMKKYHDLEYYRIFDENVKDAVGE